MRVIGCRKWNYNRCSYRPKIVSFAAVFEGAVASDRDNL